MGMVKELWKVASHVNRDLKMMPLNWNPNWVRIMRPFWKTRAAGGNWIMFTLMLKAEIQMRPVSLCVMIRTLKTFHVDRLQTESTQDTNWLPMFFFFKPYHLYFVLKKKSIYNCLHLPLWKQRQEPKRTALKSGLNNHLRYEDTCAFPPQILS